MGIGDSKTHLTLFVHRIDITSGFIIRVADVLEPNKR